MIDPAPAEQVGQVADLLPPPYWLPWLQPESPPLLIKHPVRVNTDLVGPILELPDPQPWQEPIWGRTVRLYRGNQERWNPEKRARILLKPSERDGVLEPNGQHGTGWTAYLEFIGMCWKAGATPWQTCRLLEAKPETGPGAQHRWQGVRHADLSTWFLERWNQQALDCRQPYYARQVTKQVGPRTFGNETHRAGLITESPPKAEGKPWEINDKTLERVRFFLVCNPGLNQSEVKKQAPVASKQVTSYLKELEARGQATCASGPSTGGRPPKYWTAVLTNEESEFDRQAEERARVRETCSLEALLSDDPLGDLVGWVDRG